MSRVTRTYEAPDASTARQFASMAYGSHPRPVVKVTGTRIFVTSDADDYRINDVLTRAKKATGARFMDSDVDESRDDQEASYERVSPLVADA